MTLQEFRQLYLSSQDQIGNNLQNLTTLATEFGNLVEQITQNYADLNEATETFLNQLESQSRDEQR